MLTPAEEAWSWVRERLGEGGCLAVVRDRSPTEVIKSYGIDPDGAIMLTWSETGDEEFPKRTPDGIAPYIRVGQVGDWTFAIEPLSSMAASPGLKLPGNTETLAIVTWTINAMINVTLRENGQLIVDMEVGRESERSGNDPDRFLPQMRELGMIDRPPPPPRLPDGRRDMEAIRRQYRDKLLQALALMTLAFDVQVPEEMATGALLTCQKEMTT